MKEQRDGNYRRQRAVHGRGGNVVLSQSQGVAQLVCHDRLEFVLVGTNLRGIGTSVPVPALDQ